MHSFKSRAAILSSLLCYSLIPLDANVAYVTDSGVPAIYVLDIDTNTVTQTVNNPLPTQLSSPRGVAISPDGSFAYVADRTAATIFRIDTATNQIVSTVQNSTNTSFDKMQYVAFSPDQAFAYVGSQGKNPSDFIWYVDTTTNEATTIVSGASFDDLGGLAIAPDGTFAYAADTVPNPAKIFRINTSTNAIVNEVQNDTAAPFQFPQGFTISPNSQFAYVPDWTAGVVFYVDTINDKATQLVSNDTTFLFNSPESVAFNPLGTVACMVDGGSEAAYFIDVATNAVTGVVENVMDNGGYSIAVAFSPDGRYVYVAGGDDYITQIDVQTLTAVTTTNLSSTPFQFSEAIAIWIPQTPSTITTTGLSQNSLALANYFNAHAPADALGLLTPLNGDLDALRQALKHAAPTRNAFPTWTSQLGVLNLDQIVSSYLSSRRSERRPVQVGKQTASLFDADRMLVDSSSKVPMKESPSKKPLSLWASGFGQYAQVQPQRQTPDFSATSGGVVLGGDYSGLYPQPIGAGLAYTHTHIHDKEHAGYANIDQGNLFVYSSFLFGNWYLEGALSGGYYHSHNVREISFEGYSGGKATSSIHGWQLSPHVEAGYNYWMNWLGLEPFTLFDYVATWEHGAKESGPTPFNFEQQGRYCAMLRSQTGLRVQEIIPLSVGRLTLKETLSYAYQKAFHTGTIQAFLVGSPGSVTLTTLDTAQNMGIAEVEALFTPVNQICDVSLTFHTELASRYQSYEGVIRLGKAF